MQRREFPSEFAEIPLREARIVSGEALPEGITKIGLSLLSSDAPPMVAFDVDLPAERVNVIEVRMRVDKGNQCRLFWQTDLDSALQEQNALTLPLLGQDSAHTYRFEVGQAYGTRWVSRIKQLRLELSDQSGQATIMHVRLCFEPPQGVPRLKIAGVMHEVLFGTQPRWRITVPKDGLFETGVGFAPWPAASAVQGPTTFRVWIQRENGEAFVVAERSLTAPERSWRYLTADLSAYKQEKVTLYLEVDHGETPAGQYAFWGSPMVRALGFQLVPIVLISCDTVRPDHLSGYGYKRETTPHLDAFARDAAVFTRAFCQEASTLPSHMTMLTGLYPKTHGVRFSANLAESVQTVGEVLQQAGYQTAGFVGFPFLLDVKRGFGQGFDIYDIPTNPFRNIFNTRDRVYQWLELHADAGFFLFFHNYDAHARNQGDIQLVYGPDKPQYRRYSKGRTPNANLLLNSVTGDSTIRAVNQSLITLTQDDVDLLKDGYDDSIGMIDDALGGFFDQLRDRGLYEPALIIVTSDHGEEFGEHGYFGHLQTYEECSRVVLMVKFPENAYSGRRFDGLVELTDLFATMTHSAGTSAPDSVEGQPLQLLLDGEAKPRPYAYTRRLWQEAVRTHERKIIHDQIAETNKYFDLVGDPGEQEDLSNASPQMFAALEKELERFYATTSSGWYIYIRGGAGLWKLDIEASAAARFHTATFLTYIPRKKRSSHFKIFEDGKRVRLHVESEVVEDTFYLGNDDPRAPISLVVSSQKMFSFEHDDGRVTTGKRFSVLLDPGRWPTKDTHAVPSFEVLPGVFIRYVAPVSASTPASAMGEDELEALEALGYIGDIEQAREGRH